MDKVRHLGVLVDDHDSHFLLCHLQSLVINPPKVSSRDHIIWSPHSFGFIIRHAQGKVALCGAGPLYRSHFILVAEASRLRVIIRGAIYVGLKNIVIEGDSLAIFSLSKTFGRLLVLLMLLFQMQVKF